MSARAAFMSRYLSRQAKINRLADELESLQAAPRTSSLKAISMREQELSALELQLINEGRVRKYAKRK